MKKKAHLAILLFLLLISIITSAQDLIEVADLTLKVGGKKEQIVYYAFEEGDELIFSLDVIKGKKIKEVEIIEYPNNIKYQNYKVSRIALKKLKVGKRGIYGFKFYNNCIAKKICKLNIYRKIDDLSKANFDTSVDWVEKFDTTYTYKTKKVTVGYQTINKQRTRKVIASIDTNVVKIVDRMERVHSRMNLSNASTTNVNIQLPNNIYKPHVIYPYEATEVISWAYLIVSGNSGQVWYKKANYKSFVKKGAAWATKAGLMSSGWGALAVLAVEGLSLFSNPPKGDNIKFRLLGHANGGYFSVAQGNSVAVSERITNYTQGSYVLQLTNDNLIDAINVGIKILAVTVTKKWKDEYYTVKKDVPIKELQTIKIPKVAIRKVPVMRAERNISY